MYFENLLKVGLLLAATSSAAPAHTSRDISWRLPGNLNFTSGNLEGYASKALEVAKSQLSGDCTEDKLVVRKEWGDLSASQRIDYTNAVLCLQSKPSKSPSEIVPGAKSRFDDFITTHINQTYIVHYSAYFLGWHRWYVHTYEQALRDECGYTGYQPYWDWTKSAETGLESSPVFDGSATSLSGNGAKVDGEGDVVLAGLGAPIHLPHGTGGGCVTSGPFANYTVNLGPISLSTTDGTTVGYGVNSTDEYDWNPRCMKRDLSDAVNKRYANASSVLAVLSKPQDVYDFQMTMQGYPGSGEIGVHGGGHYSMGGDPGRDFLVSPGDPAFYVHHAQIDRTWWMWQMLDPEERTAGPKALMGTGTFLNQPPSANVTYDDVMNLGYVVDGTLAMRDVMSTTAGPFCYVYA